jgi:ATP adenylyltransferase
MSYIKELIAQPDARTSATECFFCKASHAMPLDDMANHFVLRRDDHGVLMLNRYPYTNGHLMVAPLAHQGELSDIPASTRAGLMELTELGTRLLKAAINPQGVNIGINMGRCAGAGVPGHLHIHLVPRWNGDTNFMHVIGRVQVIPQALEESYAYLASVLARITQEPEPQQDQGQSSLG